MGGAAQRRTDGGYLSEDIIDFGSVEFTTVEMARGLQLAVPSPISAPMEEPGGDASVLTNSGGHLETLRMKLGNPNFAKTLLVSFAPPLAIAGVVIAAAPSAAFQGAPVLAGLVVGTAVLISSFLTGWDN